MQNSNTEVTLKVIILLLSLNSITYESQHFLMLEIQTDHQNLRSTNDCFTSLICTLFCLRLLCFFCLCVFISLWHNFCPTNIYNCLAPQSDRLNLSFVKHIYVAGQKRAINGRKTAILSVTNFGDQSLYHMPVN